jgi:hypothetical protein
VHLIAVSSAAATVLRMKFQRGAEVIPRPRPLIACAAALAAAAFGTACGVDKQPASTAKTSTAPPPAVLHGEAARAAKAVDKLGRALREGDVERLCRPGALFTAAVIHEMRSAGATCEAWVEDALAAWGPPPTAVVAVSVEPGLATARVRVRARRTIPLTLLRDGRRWLVSFSNGNDPLSALTG